MNNLRERFTKWYYRKGYRAVYKDSGPGSKDVELIFYCPWWVIPLVWFFWSPSAYWTELGHDYADAFLQGLSSLNKKDLT